MSKRKGALIQWGATPFDPIRVEHNVSVHSQEGDTTLYEHADGSISDGQSAQLSKDYDVVSVGVVVTGTGVASEAYLRGWDEIFGPRPGNDSSETLHN